MSPHPHFWQKKSALREKKDGGGSVDGPERTDVARQDEQSLPDDVRLVLANFDIRAVYAFVILLEDVPQRARDLQQHVLPLCVRPAIRIRLHAHPRLGSPAQHAANLPEVPARKLVFGPRALHKTLLEADAARCAAMR